MQRIYDEVQTPYKYGMVVAPTDEGHKIDCPTVYREGDRWYMTYVVYNGSGGTDGRGYTTWLAESSDLLHWSTLGCILDYKQSGWDMNQRGGFPSLIDWQWDGTYRMSPYKGKYWMTYIGGEGTGYEGVNAPLFIGQAWTRQASAALTTPHEWQSADKPLMHINDKDAQWWEKLIQYKSTVYEDRQRSLGHRFVLFYNAGGINPANGLKAERIGIALSDNMKRWQRYDGNPVFTHEEPGIITGDAQISDFTHCTAVQGPSAQPLYVMFYFSAFNPSRPYSAYNTFAVSRDLVHWQDWDGDDLISPSEDYDNLFAHKSYVVKHDGVVYHFYCAVNKDNQRGIAVATSKPMGTSHLHFPDIQPKGKRGITVLDEGWRTALLDTAGRCRGEYLHVSLPHNWDDYYGYRQMKHGNLHGSAIYERELSVEKQDGKRYFLQFEGVGTFATLCVNGHTFSRHPVGRTTWTVDVTDHLVSGDNRLSVRCDHPELITDMPWVCGGCSSEWGFSEGSQPFGIFRPVSLIITDEVRIEPFGIHVWNNSACDTVFIETEVKNYSSAEASFSLVHNLNMASGKRVFRLTENLTLAPHETRIVRQAAAVNDVTRWQPDAPYLYNLVSMIKRGGKTTDQTETPYGIRDIRWVRPSGNIRDAAEVPEAPGFYINGRRMFINGTCEYEHLLGAGHAFSRRQIESRMRLIRQAGFNAYREAHQPHNLLYQDILDREGILFWSQFSAHIWYDTPQFRENFKSLMRQWIKERRNSPSIILWGLQNESVLPRDFAEECTAVIREMDPTCSTAYNSSGRLVTTCNGGEGTDWNVIQNWSGTYGGSALNYDNELKQHNQLLNGEYGAWRTVGLHSEATTDSLRKEKSYSEERATDILETKVRLAESVADSVCGHFQWIFATHDNPGRVQPDGAWRMADKIGPVNFKGLTTVWEQPTDAYFMYRSNYVSPDADPMVYIASHTWADRFLATGPRRTDITVYSNCDSVMLYNSATDKVCLGRKRNANRRGTHMLWEQRLVKYNVLRAVGYRHGKAVAEDIIILNGLEQAPDFDALYLRTTIVPQAADNNRDILKSKPANYVVRMNCGGNTFIDSYGNRWEADDATYSTSWGEMFIDETTRRDVLHRHQSDKMSLNSTEMSVVRHTVPASTKGGTAFTAETLAVAEQAVRASQGEISVPIHGTRDWPLFQTFRYGRHRLAYDFPLPDGTYDIELYFAEPWLGIGGGIKTDCKRQRLFSVAVNDSIVAEDIDLWAEAGHAGAWRLDVTAEARGGHLRISFPDVKAGQAVISAIAVSTTDSSVLPLRAYNDTFWSSINAHKVERLPKELLPADDEAFPATRYTPVSGQRTSDRAETLFRITPGVAREYALRFRYKNAGAPQTAQMRIVDEKGSILVDRNIVFPTTPKKFKILSTTTGTQINAGSYSLQLLQPGTKQKLRNVEFEYLEVQ